MRLVHMKLNSKWDPSLRLWACTTDRINNGQNDTHWKLIYHRFERYKMEAFHVSTKEMRKNYYHCLVQNLDTHLRRYLHACW